MPPPPTPDDDHQVRIDQALQRIRDAKQAQEAAAAAKAAATSKQRADDPRQGRFRLDVSPFTLAWQGMALFLLGVMIGIGLHVVIKTMLG